MQEIESNQMKQKRKYEKKLPKRTDNKKVENPTNMEIDTDVKELPPSVKCLHPNCLEFVVPGNGACCLNCLAAFIYLNPQEGPALGRDLNTHIATYRSEYIKRLSFPRSVTVGNGKILNFEEGEEDKFFDTLVESVECSFMWRGCVDVIAMCNLTQLKVEIDIFDPKTDKVIERQSYEPDSDFPWLDEDANKPSKLFANQNITKIKMINYKDSHFNLIIEKDHPLLSKTNVTANIVKDRCNICQQIIEDHSTINEHMNIFHNKEIQKCEDVVKGDSIESLKIKVKLLQTQLKESEEKRKKAIVDQHEAEYATRKIRSEYETIKIEKKCLNELLELQKSEIEEKLKTQGNSTLLANPILLDDRETSPVVPTQPDDIQDPRQQQQQHLQQQLHLQQHLQDPQEQQPDLQLQEQGPQYQFQNTQQHTKESNLKANRSYKEALDTTNRTKEIIFSCQECTYPFRSKEELSIHAQRHNLLHCTKCNSKFQTKLDLKFHNTYETNCEKQWNCKECGYQGNSPTLLKTHLNETHVNPQEVSFPCTLCNDVFNTKWYFMNHMRDNHPQGKEICKHFQSGRCKFPADECWANHLAAVPNNSFECHSCKEMFNTKNQMMRHRKSSHKTKQCNEFMKGTCRHGGDMCWYMHNTQDFYQVNKTKPPTINTQ